MSARESQIMLTPRAQSFYLSQRVMADEYPIPVSETQKRLHSRDDISEPRNITADPYAPESVMALIEAQVLLFLESLVSRRIPELNMMSRLNTNMSLRAVESDGESRDSFDKDEAPRFILSLDRGQRHKRILVGINNDLHIRP